eukprot:TRINITY_DN6645_c0_g1_i1.p2 TRINITY_DN6645_c0_g1~~TRINITY_DN6645_c0_g1_i1.p2  ORF type:complete len:218 (+),score=59.03 TRINITY_DN6645_c0_g1_i1:100-753(+)
MGQCNRKDQREKSRHREHAARASAVKASAVILVHLSSPISCELHPHALDTVHSVLGLAAQCLGLERQHGTLLQLEFAGMVLSDDSVTLQEAGVHEGAQLSVLGDLDQIKLKIEKAKQVGILDASVDGWAENVSLVAVYCPSRVHEYDKGGVTALHLAAQRNEMKLASELVAAGADPLRRDYASHSAIYVAKILRHDNMVDFLKAHAEVHESGECLFG